MPELLALARFPNVAVKATGVPGYSSEGYPFRSMHAYLHQIYDAFGPERCYWGTDLTNAFAKSTYRQRITHFKRGYTQGRKLVRVHPEAHRITLITPDLDRADTRYSLQLLLEYIGSDIG